MCSPDTQYCAIVGGGSNWIFKTAVVNGCLQNATNGGQNPSVSVPGPFSFSRNKATPKVFYWLASNHILNQGTIVDGTPMTFTTTSNAFFPFDFNQTNCPDVPSGTPTSASILGVSKNDTVFALNLSWSGGQGTGTNVFAYKPGVGCAMADYAPNGVSSTFANLYAYCTPPNCATATPIGTNATCYDATGGAHNTQLSLDGQTARTSGACFSRGGAGNVALWEIATTNVQGLGPNDTVAFVGHDSLGFNKDVTNNNPHPNIRVFSPPDGTAIRTYTTLHDFPAGAPNDIEAHGGWPHPNNDDNNPWIMSEESYTSCGTNCNSPVKGQNWIWGLSVTDPLAPLIWFGPTYSAGTNSSFGCNQTIPSVSQDGNWIFFLSDDLGTAGLDSGSGPLCRVHVYHLQ